MALRILHYSDVENAFDDPDRIGRLAGCIEARRDDSTLVFGSGDTTAPCVLSLMAEGAQALDFFEAVQPDAETPGNHDFDHGPARTLEVIAASPHPWVSANVFAADGSRFGASEGLKPWTVVSADDATVGVIGVTTPETSAMSTTVDDLSFGDPVAAIREHLPALRERAEYVVVLAHLSDTDELASLPDVDVVLTGHTHERSVDRIDGTVVVRPGVNGSHVAEVTLGDDPTVTFHAVADAPRDEEVADAIAARIADSGLNERIGTVERAIPRTEAATFRAESRLGNFVADAYRWAADADVGLCSAGEPRTGEPLESVVRAKDLMSVSPFEQPLAVGELSGDRLREAFAQLRVRERYPEAPSAHVGHVAGARLTWRDGHLVMAQVDGEPVVRNRTYTVAASSHLFETDHIVSAFDASDRIRTAGKRYEALVAYGRDHGIDPEIEGRIRRE